MSLYYQDEHVTLYHGDCLTEHREWLDADVLVTDPPYGVKFAHYAMQYSNGKPVEGRRVANAVSGDSSPAARDEALRVWGKCPALVFGSWRVERPAGTRQRLIWHKANSWPGQSPHPWYSSDEEIYVLGSGFTGKPERTVYVTDELRSGSAGLAATVGHPTPKPVTLMERLVSKCPPGVIADPFAGSGATLLAARNLGRKAIGVELEERYCEVIARRLDQGVLDLAGLT